MKELLNEIENKYDQYIDKLNEQKEDDNLFFRASMAGQCIRKHFYRRFNTETSERESKSKRLLRLGNLVHEDIQNALEKFGWYKEFPLRDPIFPITGHIDLFKLFDQKAVIIDVKTISSWNWKMKFGKESEENVTHYEFQVNTYRWLLKRMWNKPYSETEGYILYYNKDNSSLKLIEVQDFILDEVESYWQKIIDLLEVVKEPKDIKEHIPIDTGLAPYFDWECNEKYCPFYKICKGEEK